MQGLLEPFETLEHHEDGDEEDGRDSRDDSESVRGIGKGNPLEVHAEYAADDRGHAKHQRQRRDQLHGVVQVVIHHQSEMINR